MIREHLSDYNFHGFCLGCGGIEYYMALRLGLQQGLCPACLQGARGDLITARGEPRRTFKCVECGQSTLKSRKNSTFSDKFHRVSLKSLSRMGYPHAPCQDCDEVWSKNRYTPNRHRNEALTCTICRRQFQTAEEKNAPPHPCPLWHCLGRNIRCRDDAVVCSRCRPRQIQVVMCKDNPKCDLYSRLMQAHAAPNSRNWTRSETFKARIQPACDNPLHPLFVVRTDLWVIEEADR